MKTDDKELVNDFQLVEWGDHEFAAWLRSKDPNWTYQQFEHPPGTYFIAHGKWVAIAFYNNAACTKKVYVRKDEL